jgi:hypothetical protein
MTVDDFANDDDYSNNKPGITRRSWQERTSSVLNSNTRLAHKMMPPPLFLGR